MKRVKAGASCHLHYFGKCGLITRLLLPLAKRTIRTKPTTRTTSIHLSASLILLSSSRFQIVIYNVDEFHGKTAFDILAVLKNAAKAVVPTESQAIYGHLIILVRDTFYDPHHIMRLIFGMEEPGRDASCDEVQALEQRNLTRRKLEAIFEEIKVWPLSRPHTKTNSERDRRGGPPPDKYMDIFRNEGNTYVNMGKKGIVRGREKLEPTQA